MSETKWKTCSKFEEYEVSTSGEIRKRGYTKIFSDGTKKEVDPEKVDIHTTSGYYYIRINGKIEKLHRLIAETFIDNPEHLKLVKHIDGNKSNNKVSNLTWSKPIPNIENYKFSGNKVKCVEDNKEFDSIRNAAEYYNTSYDKLWYLIKHDKQFEGKTFIEL